MATPYVEVYEVFYTWYQDGKITAPNYEVIHNWCEFDLVVMKFFGHLTELILEPQSYDAFPIEKARAAFEADYYEHPEKYDWVSSPHAWALFRAKLATMPPEYAEAFGVKEPIAISGG